MKSLHGVPIGALPCARVRRDHRALGRRLEALRHGLKLTDTTALTFHSLRHSFVNRCEVVGVPVTTTALIVGHAGARGGLTYGQRGSSYSGGLPVAELAKAVAKVSYGAADGLVKRTAGHVRITVRSHRRALKMKRAA